MTVSNDLIVLPKLVADKIRNYNIRPFCNDIQSLFDLLKDKPYTLIFYEIKVENGNLYKKRFDRNRMNHFHREFNEFPLPCNLRGNTFYFTGKYVLLYGQIARYCTVFCVREVDTGFQNFGDPIDDHTNNYQFIVLVNHNPMEPPSDGPLVWAYNWLKSWFI